MLNGEGGPLKDDDRAVTEILSNIAAESVDVWVMKALRELYFPKRRVSAKRLERFTATHFGPNAGYAQQYLFHYMRTKKLRSGG